jgi:predicted HTH domain antitoxin
MPCVFNLYLFNTPYIKGIFMGATVTTRVSDQIAKDLKKISREEELDMSSVVRRLLSRSISEWKVEHALKEYLEGSITLWKAARYAGLSLREMIDLAAEKGFTLQYTLEDLREDFEAAKA